MLRFFVVAQIKIKNFDFEYEKSTKKNEFEA